MDRKAVTNSISLIIPDDVDLYRTLAVFYSKYNPKEIPIIDDILDLYEEKEQDLFDGLCVKYNVNKTLI